MRRRASSSESGDELEAGMKRGRKAVTEIAVEILEWRYDAEAAMYGAKTLERF